MPITDMRHWNAWVDNNTDPYGEACVDVARQVMDWLDERPGDFDPGDIIVEASKAIGAGGLTGYMAGVVALMVSQCHSRGEEFRRKWNRATQIGDEGERANESGGVLNPALLELRQRENPE